MNSQALLADLVVVFHSFYVAFAVGGELVILAGAIFKWKFIRRIIPRALHLASVVLVAAESLLGISCPVTILENRLRTAAGQHTEEDITFVGRIIRNIIFYDFPDWVFTLMYVGFGVMVIATFVFIPPRRNSKNI